MKKVKKGIVFYLGIFLAILLAAFIICIVILIFSPGTKIFGLSYYNKDTSKTYYEAAIYSNQEAENATGSARIDTLSVSNINIISNAHDVTIMHATAADKNIDEFFGTITNKTTGFTTSEEPNSEMSVKYYQDTQTLEFYAQIPVGFFVTGNSSSINIQMPVGYNSSNINLVVENLEGKKTDGAVLIGDSYAPDNLKPATTKLNSISIKATKGLKITEYAHIGSGESTKDTLLEVDGGINVANTIYAKNLTIRSKGGSSSFAKEGAAFAVIGDLILETESVTASYGKITAASIKMKNVYGSQSFSDVTTGAFEISGDSYQCDYNLKIVTISLGAGTLKIGTRATETEEENRADKCNFTIEKLNGVRDILAGYVNISSQTFTGQTFTVVLEGEDSTNISTKMFFNDEEYTLTCVEKDGEKTYSIILNDENKIAEKLDKNDSFIGIIGDLKFVVSVPGGVAGTWVILITQV